MKKRMVGRNGNIKNDINRSIDLGSCYLVCTIYEAEK